MLITKKILFCIIPKKGVCNMQVHRLSEEISTQKSKKIQSFKSKVHIVDGFIHADTMEHFTKSALRNANTVSDIQMHYVECNSRDINTKQLDSIENALKQMSETLRRGDFVAIPGLASVPILNLQDRVREVLSKTVRLSAKNIKAYKNMLLDLLREMYIS